MRRMPARSAKPSQHRLSHSDDAPTYAIGTVLRELARMLARQAAREIVAADDAAHAEQHRRSGHNDKK